MSEVHFPEHAAWIGSEHPFDLHETYLCFRRTWQLDKQPKRAEIFISADSRYKLWLNGRFVARGPARSYPHAQCVDQLNIAPCLQPGPNVVAVQVYQPGYSHFAYVHRAAAGLLAHLTCDDQSVLVTDRSWRTRRDPSFAHQVPRISIYGGGVEERDLNLDDDWTAGTTYDDADWAPARIVAPVGGYPWTDLQPRAVPLLVERESAMIHLETRCGPSPTPHPADAHACVRRGWISAVPRPIRAERDGWYELTLAEGRSAYWLFDLGRDYTCQGWLEIEGAGGQEQLCISYAEKMRHGQLVLSDPETYCRVRLTDRFRLRPGSQVAEGFSLRGGRYLLFQLTGPTGRDFRIRPHVRLAEYPLEITRELHTSDPLLAQVITLCEETVHACLLDGFIDSTWRESAQWVGDALPQSLALVAMAGDVRPLGRVIEMAAQAAYPDGMLPSVLPGEVHAYTVLDFNLVWMELLSLYWKLGHDPDFVAAMWPTLVKMLDRLQKDLNPAGLLMSQPGRRLFLDWAPLSRNEPNAVYNLHYLLALRQAVQLAADRGAAGQEADWRARMADLQAAIQTAFWHQERWYDDLECTTFSQLAAALALLAEATPPGHQNGLLEDIAARSLDRDDEFDSDKMVLASPFMHHYIFEALRRGGKSKQVVEIVRRRWGRWVQAGYPTAWENWNVDFPDGSQCHAFSAHPRYHLAEIARELGSL
jgi:alpha-L-rhamnosidase